jgi:uncharacterized membrane protein YsdA (DUF1294 family)
VTILNYVSIFLITYCLSTSYFLGYTPLIVSVLYILVSLLTFLTYFRDKHAAQKGSWRISENILHVFSLFCGWPGAIIAQQKFRHKTKKVSFRFVFWITVLVNSGGLIWLHTSEGSSYLHNYTSEIEKLIMSEISEGKSRNTLFALLKFQTY